MQYEDRASLSLTSINNLASVLYDRCKYTEAEELFASAKQDVSEPDTTSLSSRPDTGCGIIYHRIGRRREFVKFEPL
jgi:hypothetical protein